MRRLLTTALLSTCLASASAWRPVDPSELRPQAPRLDPNSDAEVVFWEITVDDQSKSKDLRLVTSHYLRVKIFTERGVRRFATVEIPRTGDAGFGARTIKADGAIRNVAGDGVFEREVVKSKGVRMMSTSVVLSDLAPGDLIEYRWQEVRVGVTADETRIDIQRDIPVQRVICFVRPSPPAPGMIMRARAFQAATTGFKPSIERPGYFVTEARDIPAYVKEPFSPPGYNARAFVLVYYDKDGTPDLLQYWKDAGRAAGLEAEKRLTIDPNLRKFTEALTQASPGPNEKLTAIDQFCRQKIRIEEAPEHAAQQPHETWKRKSGSHADVLYLFIAMARAAGLDAHTCRVADREDMTFDPGLATMHFLGNSSAAVRIGSEWKFFDPATPYLQPSMLRWQEEGQMALIASAREGGFFLRTPSTPVAENLKRRRGEFTLSEDGTLEGTVELEYTGHAGIEQKASLEGMSPAEQIEDWNKSTRERFTGAQISNVLIEGASRSSQSPLRIRYTVSIPNFALRSNRRLFLNPAVFQRNVAPLFGQKAARRQDFFFPYAWSEDDQVRISLPSGWTAESDGFEQRLGLGNYSAVLYVTDEGNTLVLKRLFTWGADGRLRVPASEAESLLTLATHVHAADSQSISISTRTPSQ